MSVDEIIAIVIMVTVVGIVLLDIYNDKGKENDPRE